jgi:hypothetical protein
VEGGGCILDIAKYGDLMHKSVELCSEMLSLCSQFRAN